MPNHVTNILTVSGPAEIVERFRVAVSTENPVLKARILKDLVRQKEEILNNKSFYNATYMKKQIDSIDAQIKSGEPKPEILNFNGTVPMPEELEGTVSGSENSKPEWQKEKSKELIQKYGTDNWYEWCQRNYGTKWGAYEVEELIVNGEEEIVYQYQTAWCPPNGWLDKTSAMYPKLLFNNAWRSEGGEAGVLSICVDDGVEYQEDMSESEWLMTYDEEYKKEHDFIAEGDYKEVVVSYTKENFVQYHFRKLLLDRIKDEDLPLFINFDWDGDEDVEEEYKERLTHVTSI
jgi:hypothetical protein